MCYITEAHLWAASYLI